VAKLKKRRSNLQGMLKNRRRKVKKLFICAYCNQGANDFTLVHSHIICDDCYPRFMAHGFMLGSMSKG